MPDCRRGCQFVAEHLGLVKRASRLLRDRGALFRRGGRLFAPVRDFLHSRRGHSAGQRAQCDWTARDCVGGDADLRPARLLKHRYSPQCARRARVLLSLLRELTGEAGVIFRPVGLSDPEDRHASRASEILSESSIAHPPITSRYAPSIGAYGQSFAPKPAPSRSHGNHFGYQPRPPGDYVLDRRQNPRHFRRQLHSELEHVRPSTKDP